MADRREFFKRAAGLLAAAAVAKLPVVPEPVPERWCPECGRTLAADEPVCALCAIPERVAPPDVVEFKVFGRNVMYSVPGPR